ncbi:hypothetical protein [Lactiplantibacillus paraxiangfangensis]|uniref:hypothetical protein n=1 Tax=Lactiplantibacillus paraxiangfangensis TaxID=3076224 RepID=UPI0030C6CEB5
MWDFIKKHWIGLTGLLVLVIIAIPASVLFFMDKVFYSIGNGTDDGWLGFWGGYLGSIVGVVGAALFAYINTRIQLKNERNRQVQQEKRQAKRKNYEMMIRYISDFKAKMAVDYVIWEPEETPDVQSSLIMKETMERAKKLVFTDYIHFYEKDVAAEYFFDAEEDGEWMEAIHSAEVFFSKTVITENFDKLISAGNKALRIMKKIQDYGDKNGYGKYPSEFGKQLSEAMTAYPKSKKDFTNNVEKSRDMLRDAVQMIHEKIDNLYKD